MTSTSSDAANSAAAFGLNDTFTNAGAITASEIGSPIYGPASAVRGGDSIVNDGTINVGNAVGVYLSRSLDNRGSILQIVGDAPATGVRDVALVTNSGTIQVDGIAIDNAYTSGTVRINNASGGTIASTSRTAMRLYGGYVTNAGAITGTVDLGYAPSYDPSVPARNSYSNAYIGQGGTLEGDVLFGEASDLFLQYGADSGVNGTIDGGAGIDTAAFVLDQDATVTIAGGQLANFENAFVYLSASDATASLDAAALLMGDLYLGGSGSIVNDASVEGSVFTQTPGGFTGLLPTSSWLAAFDNRADIVRGVSGTIETLTNSGRIVTDVANATALALYLSGGATPIAATIVNSGTIGFDVPSYANPFIYGVGLTSDVATSATLTNAVDGIIRAGGISVAISAANVALTINNAGTIEGGGPGSPGRYIGGAISMGGSLATSIVNSGTITGQIILSSGDDRVENSGLVDGPVQLGGGNDTFVLRGQGTFTRTIDGGTGSNQFIVDSTGDGSLAGTDLYNFASLTQLGTGTFKYSDAFAVPTIGLQSGTLSVVAGNSLSTASATTITGADGGATADNAGTIAGNVLLGSGTDAVINSGTILGTLDLGAGDDSYTELVGGSVARIDGGTGIDLYRIRLAGDRTGIGGRANFEQLAVEGSGTLTLALDQDYQLVALSGVAIDAALAGFTIGRIDGSAGAERVTLDGDVAAIALGDGDDLLTLGGASAAGFYDGGVGTDALVFRTAGPLTLTGTITRFESVATPSNALVVAGTLGRAGERLSFGGAAQSLTVANGGTLAGTVDLGDGDDSFRLNAGGTLAGTVSGGAGNDMADINTANPVTLVGGSLVGFEQLVAQGSALLTLAHGDFAFDTGRVDGDLTIAADASLTTSMLVFGPAANTFTIAGGFASPVNGGTGSDVIVVSGGSAASPVAFTDITSVEALQVSAGLVRIAGTATFGDIALTGGRLIGLAGSTITAPTISVSSAATFGSAGTVNGNISVAGTLSPGASPGVMTVNGNVGLGANSISLFEITPAASDKLVVNGTLAIAQGATLQIVADQSLTPGQSLDLAVASDGISGSYANVVKPTSLFGYLVQDANTITLRGQFLNDTGYSPQVQGSIAYLNAVLTSGQAAASLLAAVPQLVNAAGVADQAGFAQLTPEAYASATQLTYETGLALAQAGRGSAFAPTSDEPRIHLRQRPCRYAHAQSRQCGHRACRDRQLRRARRHRMGQLALLDGCLRGLFE